MMMMTMSMTMIEALTLMVLSLLSSGYDDIRRRCKPARVAVQQHHWWHQPEAAVATSQTALKLMATLTGAPCLRLPALGYSAVHFVCLIACMTTTALSAVSLD